MVYEAEECLRKARQHEENARAVKEEDVKTYFRALAEHWRTLSMIAVTKPPGRTQRDCSSDVDWNDVARRWTAELNIVLSQHSARPSALRTVRHLRVVE
jgi:hypothetical protein